MRSQVGWGVVVGLALGVLASVALDPPCATAGGQEAAPDPVTREDGVAAVARPPEPAVAIEAPKREPADELFLPELPVRESVPLAAIPEPGVRIPLDPNLDPSPVDRDTPAGEALLIADDDPLFQDVRADVMVKLPPGIPVPTYPIVVNGLVETLIDYFTARERERFGMWIARSGRYLGMIRRVFRDRGLPEELAYTAMIESGFSARAISRVGAKGLWQFMEATAQRYGLTVNRWLDERLDPVKSTVAAAQYLGDLYRMFGHWFLAQAAYNAGEARVAQAIQRAGTSDFWALTQTRHLPNETKLFVPQILAATVITKAPSRYGFDVATESPLEYDEVIVSRSLDLETVATLAGVPVEEVRQLNPALRAGITPPFGPYNLRLPMGTGGRFSAAIEQAPGVATWVVHRVGRNQSLTDIARLYRVSPQRLADVNQLHGGRLRGVPEILVPVVRRFGARPPTVERVTRAQSRTPGVAEDDEGQRREVVVRSGDTLWGIATRHGIEPHALARLNGRGLEDPLYSGERLKLQ
jgi:peptidoglycan lytic transglycosylase D